MVADELLGRCRQFTQQAVRQLNLNLKERRCAGRKQVSDLQMQLRVNEHDIAELREQVETADEEIKEQSKNDRELQEMVEQ